VGVQLAAVRSGEPAEGIGITVPGGLERLVLALPGGLERLVLAPPGALERLLLARGRHRVSGAGPAFRPGRHRYLHFLVTRASAGIHRLWRDRGRRWIAAFGWVTTSRYDSQ
jgi:hypothetical protein